MEYFVGIIVSLMVERFKKQYGSDTFSTYIAIALLALLSSVAYTLILNTPYAQTLINILATAGAFHNFILRRL